MTPIPGMDLTVGEAILQQRGLGTSGVWIWLGLLANIAITFFYLLLTLVAMSKLEWAEPVNVAPEQIEYQKNKGAGDWIPASPEASEQTHHTGTVNLDEEVVNVEEMKEGYDGDFDEESRPSYYPHHTGPRFSLSKEENMSKPRVASSTASGMNAIPVVPLTLTFEDVWYSVSVKGQGKVDILQGITGVVPSGQVLALMGASGKTNQHA